MWSFRRPFTAEILNPVDSVYNGREGNDLLPFWIKKKIKLFDPVIKIEPNANK
jgi:hypothetical protein